MKRRTALGLLAGASGAVLLPATGCKTKDKQSSENDKSELLGEDQDEALLAIGAAILPSGATAGLTKNDIVYFRKKMNDCTEAEERKEFLSGWKTFQDGLNKKADGKFAALAAGEKSKIIAEYFAAATDGEKKFADEFKSKLVRAYTGGEYYLTNVQHYKLIPGNYVGCKNVDQISIS